MPGKQPRVLFILDNGGERILSKKAAKTFEMDFVDMIKEKHDFDSVAALQQWKKDQRQYAKSTETPTTPESGTITPAKKITPTKMDMQKAILALKSKRANNRIVIHYRTAASSAAVLVIFQHLDAKGKPMWFVKAVHTALALPVFAQVCNIDNTYVQFMIDNVTTARMRDLNGDPNTVQKQSRSKTGRDNNNNNTDNGKPAAKRAKKETSSASSTREYDEMITYTHFLLPKLNTKAEETDFIEKTCNSFGKTLKELESAETYLPLLMEAHQSDKFQKMLEAPENGPTYQQYIASCDIKLEECDNLNKFVVLDDTKPMKELQVTHFAEKEYELEDDSEPTEDEDDDETHD